MRPRYVIGTGGATLRRYLPMAVPMSSVIDKQIRDSASRP
jgi:hypothetical protein